MNRRKFIKLSTTALGAAALLPGHLPAQAKKTAAPASSGASGTGKVPDYAKDMLHSDMDGIGPDGKPTGQKATYTGAERRKDKPHLNSRQVQVFAHRGAGDRDVCAVHVIHQHAEEE